MDIVRAGIVGCGRIADLHELGYRSRDDAQIVAVNDVKPKRAAKKAEEWGISRIYANYEDLLADPDIDLVELLVPHHLHAEMTVAACQAGKHVSVQKPMALTPAEADRMIRAADEAGVVLRVYENFVFYPPHVYAKKMIDEGEIGTLKMIRMHVTTGRSEGMWKVPLNAWAWRFNEKKSGGGPTVFDHGNHLFSLAIYLMGDVEQVAAWIDQTRVLPGIVVDAPATIMFKFKSQHCYGMLDFVYAPGIEMDTKYYSDDDRLEVVGEKGIIFVNRCTSRSVDRPPLELFRDGKTTPIPVERVEWHDSFIDATHHLVDVLRYGGTPRLDGVMGKKVLEFSLAALISAIEKCEVKPDEVRQYYVE